MPRFRRNPSIRIRVQDKDNTLASSAALGRAVGWAQMKVRQLNRALWRSDPDRTHLPARTYRYAMPGSTVSMIEIKTSPPAGMWLVRIVGDSSKFGNFMWVPTEGPDFPDVPRDQILVKAEGFGGAYNVEIQPDLIAKGIDWKGFTRTEDISGNELSRPITDVLTWEGPGARYINYAGGSALGREVFKDGVEYTDTSKLLNHLDGFGLGDSVVGAAIQGTFGSPEGRRDVLVTRGDFSEFSGAQGIGFLSWKIWTRNENGTDGEFVPVPAVPDPDADPQPNPNGWKLIATIDAPDNVAVNRYGRMPIWFFNQSGTEASLMLPVQDSGIKPRRQRSFFVIETIPRDFPMELQLATLSIDAFAETASIAFEAREPEVTGQQVDTFTGDASGGLTNFCEGCASGSRQGSLTTSSVWTFNGEVRRVAVDYKGDTRVFATMALRQGAGTSFIKNSSFATTFQGGDPVSPGPGFPASCPTETTLNADFENIEKFGWDLRVGGATMAYKYEDETSTGDLGGQSDTQTDENGLNFNGGLQWMDLRNDLIVYVSHSRTVSQTVGPATSFNGTTVVYGDSTNTGEQIVGVRAVRGSTTLVDYEERVTLAARQTGAGLFTNFFPNNFIGFTSQLVTSGNFCRFGVPADERPTRVTTILTFFCNCTNSEVETPRNLNANKVSLESMQFDDTDTLNAASGSNSILLNSTHATDTAGNVALSIRTYEGRTNAIGVWPGPARLNFIDGDDLIDVMNQVTYVDPGPDAELGTADDFDLPPLDDTARAKGLTSRLGTLVIL